jgi:hypothetical protein
MKKDDLQTIDQIRLLNQKNALKSNDTMAKWKGLDMMMVNLLHVVKPLLHGWLDSP